MIAGRFVIALVGIIALGVALGMATHREQYSSPAA
jgi:hypothetical protein